MNENQDKKELLILKKSPRLTQEKRLELVFRPFLQISYKGLYLDYQIQKSIGYVLQLKLVDFSQKKENSLPSDESTQMTWGLDCTGQGECQPHITPSDGENMHSFFHESIHKKKQ